MTLMSSMKSPVRTIDGLPQTDHLLDDVGLLECKTQAAGTFSGGMKRRLSVAMSLVGNPRM
jgi:ABC-type multidrug transport system ATPase subunit